MGWAKIVARDWGNVLMLRALCMMLWDPNPTLHVPDQAQKLIPVEFIVFLPVRVLPAMWP